jgi:hypothetical protein
MIDGLKLTMTGEELRARLDERVRDHERRAAWYKREATRAPEDDEDDDPILPEHMCEYEQEFHKWRAKTLACIREHLEGGEVYRLDETDLKFGELLPEIPGIVAQDEYECEHRIGFGLERLPREIRGLPSGRFDLGDLRLPKPDAGRVPTRRGAKPRRAQKAAAKRA